MLTAIGKKDPRMTEAIFRVDSLEVVSFRTPVMRPLKVLENYCKRYGSYTREWLLLRAVV